MMQIADIVTRVEHEERVPGGPTERVVKSKVEVTAIGVVGDSGWSSGATMEELESQLSVSTRQSLVRYFYGDILQANRVIDHYLNIWAPPRFTVSGETKPNELTEALDVMRRMAALFDQAVAGEGVTQGRPGGDEKTVVAERQEVTDDE